MFLVNNFLKGGGGGGFNASGIIGGIISAVSEAAAQYNPEPPPPRYHPSHAEAHESEEESQFRRLFKQLAGEDMEVSAPELMNIMNKVVSRHPDLKTDGFSIESCRCIVADLDSDSTGKLGFEEFKYLWNNIKKWQAVYKRFDADRSGTISASELPGAFEAAGFRLNGQLYQMIFRKYADENACMDFDNYICCLVRLDAMFRAFKVLDKDGNGNIKVTLEEWLMVTMRS
ncbi:calpain small subunit 1 [Rhinatrema bivittatum]|uniref:calpain small subunit 1 n=1 Tax=Rhinatrema bivittatum TaxID=194408 RepID=UPI001127821D|nr:calpain small subunit 1 [Rhinatrema bivittatum]XP_029475932.1 calpain small subunit 1 [Rhinatrema bivittatum]